MQGETVQEAVQRLVDLLPDDATWEDLQYQIYFRQSVETGLEDSRAGRVVSQEEARRRFAPEES